MANATYDDVEKFAALMLEADETEHQTLFEEAYNGLRNLCEANQGTMVDHPIQWEVLADFTMEIPQAMQFYQQGLVIAKRQTNKEYLASLNFALAEQYFELEQQNEALTCLKEARKAAKKIKNQELRENIEHLWQESQPREM
ncbi:Uncharacterised protein [BD1-7 clade bacterium]|uniref:Tetratricopeptide repeat protein n=1 Tax=BD1-7 clade bacterium TaxID=2029982 RepID=A0A5S9PMP3_9GAMM|nr:Uncharacterised protein [BD1-7 clade bacterium]CAA0105731.1 Uncharacterised protein [BD1-7 clade bacterium]